MLDESTKQKVKSRLQEAPTKIDCSMSRFKWVNPSDRLGSKKRNSKIKDQTTYKGGDIEEKISVTKK